MGLLQKLLSTLGLRESSAGRGSERSGETTVTVEHEPDTASESAVKGTDAVGTGTGATGSTDAVADTADEEPGAAEPAEAASSTGATDAETADVPEAEPEAGSEADEETAEAATEDEPAETATESEESPDVLNGIGPAYAERLENAGVDTVGELAAADAADLADETGLGEGRISNWIEQAKEY